MPAEPSYYYNTGSCVHPRCITCIEIEQGRMALVKWSMSARADSTLYVAREQIAQAALLSSLTPQYGIHGAGTMQVSAW